jgi:predicted metal-dependent hydrolase
MSSTGPSRKAVLDARLPLPVVLREIRGARRFRLRLDRGGELLRLSGPMGMDRRRALTWAAQQRSWVEQQIAARPPAEPFAPGLRIPLEGQEVLLVWQATAPRLPYLDGGTLCCGGPADAFAGRMERFLKRRALEVLAAETRALADGKGLHLAGVSVGDADTRWGSCSERARIRYNWRLILAPREARRFVVAHEVAHLAHLNHGPAFKALERELFGGDPAPARALLRSVGQRLKGVGRRR